jgi:hypothetical protein
VIAPDDAETPPEDLHPEEILVDPGNPYDFSQEEIDKLVDELRRAEPDAEILSHFRDETEYGGGITELVHLWIQLKDAGIEFRHLVNEDWPSIAFIATAVGWLRKRWKNDKDKNPLPRPRQLRVYDQEARRIVQVDIDLPDGEPKVRMDDSDRHHHDKPVGARRRNPDPPDPEVDDPEDPEQE